MNFGLNNMLTININRYLELLISHRECAVEPDKDILAQLATCSEVVLESLSNGNVRVWYRKRWEQDQHGIDARRAASAQDRQARFARDEAFSYILRLANAIAVKLGHKDNSQALILAKQLIDFPQVVNGYGVTIEKHSTEALKAAKQKEI